MDCRIIADLSNVKNAQAVKTLQRLNALKTSHMYTNSVKQTK